MSTSPNHVDHGDKDDQDTKHNNDADSKITPYCSICDTHAPPVYKHMLKSSRGFFVHFWTIRNNSLVSMFNPYSLPMDPMEIMKNPVIKQLHRSHQNSPNQSIQAIGPHRDRSIHSHRDNRILSQLNGDLVVMEGCGHVTRFSEISGNWVPVLQEEWKFYYDLNSDNIVDKGDSYLVRCPHCDGTFDVRKDQINCKIFRHGFYMTNGKHIDPHAPKETCDKLIAEGKIYGCGGPFTFDGKTVEICEYK